MHDESTDSNTDASAATNTNTATGTEADTNAENSESGYEETIPVVLNTALTASTASNRNTLSLPGKLLSKHMLRSRNTGREKSVRIAGVDTK
jgi:hypothetical protein